MSTESKTLEERCAGDAKVRVKEGVAVFDPKLLKTLQQRGLIRDGEQHWAGEISFYVIEPAASYNPNSSDDVTYGNMRCDYDEDVEYSSENN